jgi:hypothetical protein
LSVLDKAHLSGLAGNPNVKQQQYSFLVAVVASRTIGPYAHQRPLQQQQHTSTLNTAADVASDNNTAWATGNQYLRAPLLTPAAAAAWALPP